MENEKIAGLFEEVRLEIQAKYDEWDLHIEAEQQPVPIQDLDYWSKRLEYLIGKLKNV